MKKKLLSEINRMRELAGILSENNEMLNEVDTSVMGGVAKKMYLDLSKMKPNFPVDVNGAQLKNDQGGLIGHDKKVKMTYQNSSAGMDKLAMQGKAKEFGQKGSAEVMLIYSMDSLNALGFVKKSEADAALGAILKQFPQVTGKVVEKKMDYDWAKNYAPTYAIYITMKSDKDVAKSQSARPAVQQQPAQQPLQQAAE